MEVTIYVNPATLWDYFQKNKTRLKTESMVVAENKDDNIILVLSNYKDRPLVSIVENGRVVQQERIICKSEVEIIVNSYINAYLFDVTKIDLELDYEPDLDEMKDIVVESEGNINRAFCEFLNVLNIDGNEISINKDRSYTKMMNSVIDLIGTYYPDACRPHIVKTGNKYELVYHPYLS